MYSWRVEGGGGPVSRDIPTSTHVTSQPDAHRPPGRCRHRRGVCFLVPVLGDKKLIILNKARPKLKP